MDVANIDATDLVRITVFCDENTKYLAQETIKKARIKNMSDGYLKIFELGIKELKKECKE